MLFLIVFLIMSKYYISTVLWTTDIKEFADDRTAWEELRKLLPHKFATLLKEKEVEVEERDLCNCICEEEQI